MNAADAVTVALMPLVVFLVQLALLEVVAFGAGVAAEAVTGWRWPRQLTTVTVGAAGAIWLLTRHLGA